MLQDFNAHLFILFIVFCSCAVLRHLTGAIKSNLGIKFSRFMRFLNPAGEFEVSNLTNLLSVSS